MKTASRTSDRRAWFAATLAATLFLATGIAQGARTELKSAPTALQDALQARFESGVGAPSDETGVHTQALVQRVYAERDYVPAWVEDTGPTPRAQAIVDALAALPEDGLDPNDYGYATIERLATSNPAIFSPEVLAELEVRLSMALVQVASDLASGRVEPRRVNPDTFVYPDDVDRAAVLRLALASDDIGDYVHSFRPAQDNYRRLKEGLARYRELARRYPVWPPVAEGPTLALDVHDPRVAIVRARLEILGDLEPDPSAGDKDLFDAILEEAVKRFQARHGLDVDGRIGKMTRAALDVSPQARVRQMLLNMERRRWMPDRFEARYVFVNLADFELKVVDTREGRERTIHTTDVVVGRPYHQTPEFSNAIRYLVINPYWNVPPSIARNEILPKVKADRSYLSERNFDVLDGWGHDAAIVDPTTVDWSSIGRRSLPYRFRQGPGSDNALGRLKFMLPNEHNIYLHDTPARSLFARTQRTFSHGCIRVQDPDALAATLLQWQSGWSIDRVNARIESGERTVVSLREPIPVHIAYVTAWVNRDGSVHFRDDVYGRDATLATALLRSQAPSSAAKALSGASTLARADAQPVPGPVASAPPGLALRSTSPATTAATPTTPSHPEV